MNKSKIVIERKSRYFDSLRKYNILIDGNTVGRIGDGESKTLEIDPGKHTIMLKIDWGRSNELAFDANIGGITHFKCENSIKGIKMPFAVIYALVQPHKYIELKIAE